MRKLRVLLTGGRTGGHIYPLVAVGAELQTQCGQRGIALDLRYLGAYGPFKGLLEANNIKVGKVAESKLRRYMSIHNFIDGPKFVYSFMQAMVKIFFFMPDVVFSKGGPGALAVVMAAKFYFIPVIVHESDAVPGLTNLLSSKFAKLVLTSFPGVENYFPGRKVMLIGNPIRRSLLAGISTESKQKNKGAFGFDPQFPLILVIGGSQGATSINDFVLDNLSAILQVTQVLHQTGTKNYEQTLKEVSFIVEKMPEEISKRYKAFDYFGDEINLAYIASDLIVSRSSAGAIFEIAAFGKPSILIPLPPNIAANDHQTKNAYDYAAGGAAEVMEQTNLLPNLFINHVKKIVEDQTLSAKMSNAALAFAKPEAASKIAQIILELTGNAT